jgi:phosphopantetheinyl transferase
VRSGCIEIERNLGDLAGMARQIMSPTEFQCFQSKAAHLAAEAFFGLWTRKEALLKANGMGFSTDPRELNLGLKNREAAVSFSGAIWSVASLGALLPLQAAIAVSGELPAIQTIHSHSATD